MVRSKVYKKIIVVIIIFFIFYLSIFSKVKKDEWLISDILSTLFKPGEIVATYIRKQIFIFNERIKGDNLVKENYQLKKELAKLKETNNRLVESYLRLKREKEIFKFSQEFPYKTIKAKVIARDPTTWYKTVSIDKGRKDGIKINMPVVTYEGLVGRIYKVNKYTSLVLLLIDSESAVGSRLQRSRDTGVVIGKGENLQFEYLAKSSKVKVGDKVITSGLSEFFPPGILIGEVVNINRKNTQFTLKVEVAPAVRFGRLEEVLIIIDRINKRYD